MATSSVDCNSEDIQERLALDKDARDALIGQIVSELDSEVVDEVHNNIDDGGAAPSITSMVSAGVRDMDTRDVARLEFGETAEIRTEKLRKFQTAILNCPQFKNFCKESNSLRLTNEDDIIVERFLLRFLRHNKFNVVKSMRMLESYSKMRQTNPNWYSGLGDVDNLKGALELLGNGYFFVAPGRDRLGRRVVINMAQKLDPHRHTAIDMMRCAMMTLETLLTMDEETQIRGLTYVFDCKHLSLGHCKLWSPSDAARMFKDCEKNIPLRHRAMFVINTPFGMGAVIEFVKSFLSAKIKKRINVVHSSPELINHTDELLNDPEVLPIEFLEERGKYSAAEMASLWKQVVLDHAQHLRNLDELVIEKPEETNNELNIQKPKKCWYSFW